MRPGSDHNVPPPSKTRRAPDHFLEIRSKNDTEAIPWMGVKSILVFVMMDMMNEQTEPKHLHDVVTI